MQEPVELLQLAARKANALMLWTHFYDAAVLEATQPATKFGPLEPRSFDGLVYEAAEQRYLEALDWAGFCGWLHNQKTAGFWNFLDWAEAK